MSRTYNSGLNIFCWWVVWCYLRRYYRLCIQWAGKMWLLVAVHHLVRMLGNLLTLVRVVRADSLSKCLSTCVFQIGGIKKVVLWCAQSVTFVAYPFVDVISNALLSSVWLMVLPPCFIVLHNSHNDSNNIDHIPVKMWFIRRSGLSFDIEGEIVAVWLLKQTQGLLVCPMHFLQNGIKFRMPLAIPSLPSTASLYLVTWTSFGTFTHLQACKCAWIVWPT